ncbi:MAG TPA: hypothetical protein VJ552_08280 [Sediminibacterium sp.]|nr:hypothetical protein [Sediminibacterium sp.]
MKRKNLAGFVLAMFSIMTVSCKKDCPKDPAPVPQAKKLYKIMNDPREFRLFEYNANGDVSQLISQFVNNQATNSVTVQTNKFVYENNQLKRVNNEGGYLLYHYTGTRLDSIQAFAINDRRYSSLFPQFNAQNQLVSLIEIPAKQDPGLPVESKMTYEYAASGNIDRYNYFIKETTGSDFRLVYRTVFSDYDNSPYQENFTFSGIYLRGVVFMKNNPRKIEETTPAGAVYETTWNEYTYDADQYVIKRKQSYSTTNVVITYEYSYY